MAIIMPFMSLVLLAAADFGRLFYVSIELRGAARAGAQYGSQSIITAADSTGMSSVASGEAPNVTGMSVSSTQCTCQTSTMTACPSAYCTNLPSATYVTVSTSATFTTLVNYPGIPHSISLTGSAVMPVQE
jgi:Flp pilus assembly protein TadG